MHKTRIFLFATSCFVAISGCDLAEQKTDSPTRSFAPRMVDIPMSKFVRLEVAEYNIDNLTDGNKPNGFYADRKVDYSTHQIASDGVPSDRPMYFRLSGLDSNSTTIWMTSGSIPDGGSPDVTVGYGTSFVPKTISPPSISATAASSNPIIQCTGGGTPAWTVDGSEPSQNNKSSTRYIENGTQPTVNLGTDQRLIARCTDHVVWSTSTTYKVSGPTTPTAIGEGTNFPAPSLGIPMLSSGNISFSANTSPYPNYSNWKVVYQVSSSPSAWNIGELNSNVPYNGSGTIQAYLIAWDGTKWVSGYPSRAGFPNSPTPNGPGTAFSAPTIKVSTFDSGSITFSNNYPSGSYSYWKIAFKLSGASNWTVEDLNQASVPYGGSGTITAYLIAWDGMNWVQGYSSTANYPNKPIANGPGTSISAPTINIPATSAGKISFATNIPTASYSSMKIAYQFSGTNNWIVEDFYTASVPFNGSGSITAYIMAWDGNSWISGYSNMANYPNGPIANGPGTSFSAPVINVPASGNITFTNNSPMGTYSNWKVAYQLPGMPAWTLIDLQTASVPFSGSGTITAYFMAWNGSSWVSGYPNSANYPNGPTANGPGTSFSGPIINIPATASGNITFTNNTPYGNYSNWKVAYQFSGTSGWTMADLNTASVPYSGTGSISAYLMAWDGIGWASGIANSATYPKGPIANGPGISIIPPTINVMPAGNITFNVNTTSYPNYTNWKIVYQWGTAGSWNISDLFTTSLPYSGTGSITAYIMAWDGTNWVSGNSTNANYPKGPTPPTASGPGSDLPQISLTPPTAIPGSIQFTNPGVMGSYTDWKVAYWTTEINQWKIIDLSVGSIPVSTSGSVYAYLMAWDPMNSRWLYGMQAATTYPTAIAAPVFRDMTGTQLGTSMEIEGSSISLRVEATNGNIFYTTDGTTPIPGNTSTNPLTMSSLYLPFPIASDSLVVNAVAMIAANVSPVTSLTIYRPGWKLLNTAKAGCIQTDKSITVACGDASGPWLWDSFTSNWVMMSTNWSSSPVTSIAITPTDILFATATGEIMGLDRTSASPTFWQLGSRVSGSIAGVAIHSDTAWISTSSGPMFYDANTDSWAYLTGTEQPTSGGPVYSDGNALWMASGTNLWRYGPEIFGISGGWNNWGTANGTIYTIGENPFNSNGGTVIGTYNGLQIIDAITPGIPSLSLGPDDAKGLRSFTSVNSNLFAAYDDGNGLGGIYSANGWNAANKSISRGWPGGGATSKAAALGISTYTNTDGNWMIASTEYGTYRIKMR